MNLNPKSRDKTVVTRWTETLIQVVLTQKNAAFGFTRYSVIPNVSYGAMGNREADLICITRGDIIHEVEIKTSIKDLCSEKKKRPRHDNCVQYKWLAIPSHLLQDAIEANLIPDMWGIVTVSSYLNSKGREVFYTRKIKSAKRMDNPKMEASKVKHILELGVMRMWSMKHRALLSESHIKHDADKEQGIAR